MAEEVMALLNRYGRGDIHFGPGDEQEGDAVRSIKEPIVVIKRFNDVFCLPLGEGAEKHDLFLANTNGNSEAHERVMDLR